MDIVFKTKKLQKLCSNEQEMTRTLGPNGARKLRARLADLRAAERMSDVRRGRPHALHGSFEGCRALDLDGGCRLVVESADEPPPLMPDGSLDWSQVTAVRVLFIGDYHE